jgi:hypothetical protein
MTDPDRFRGQLSGYLAWAAFHWSGNPDWCARHWAPCPVEGRNGIKATSLVFHLAFHAMPAEVQQGTAVAQNLWRHTQKLPSCCRLGDQKIADIWARCGSEPEPASPVG